MKTYKQILSEEINKEIDTDHGILRAFWSTLSIMIKQKSERQECLKFLQEFGRQFGNFKLTEAKGDFIDAKLL